MAVSTAQIDAIHIADRLRERLVDFALEESFVRDQKLLDLVRLIWAGSPADGGLVSDLWVEGVFPSQLTAHSLASLAKERIFDAELMRVLDKNGVVPKTRPLYTHQEVAIRVAQAAEGNSKKPVIVVTAGTGAGKTESFLLPALNVLMRSETPAEGGGMSCRSRCPPPGALLVFFRAFFHPDDRRGAMTVYGRMGDFCGLASSQLWRSNQPKPSPTMAQPPVRPAISPWWRDTSPQLSLAQQFVAFLEWCASDGAMVLRKTASQLLAETGLAGAVERWPEILAESRRRFDQVVSGWLGSFTPLLETWIAIPEDGQRNYANRLHHELDAAHKITVVEALAEEQFLPRYGFPIGLMKLQVRGVGPFGGLREEDQFRLERAGIQALGEYVPGSRLLAGGRLITSRGVLKNSLGVGEGPEQTRTFGVAGWYGRCLNGHFLHDFGAAPDVPVCSLCGAAAGGTPRQLIVPRHGFCTAAWETPARHLGLDKVGVVTSQAVCFRGDGAVQAERELEGSPGVMTLYREGGELLVFNEGDNGHGFAICATCGFAESETHPAQSGIAHLLKLLLKHRSLHHTHRAPCEHENIFLRNRSFAARVITDVALLDFYRVLAPAQVADEALMLTIGKALQVAGARLLNLDIRELGSLTAPAGSRGQFFGAVVHDNVPGGAGHTAELLARGREWLLEARSVLWRDDNHHTRCQHGCLDCVLTYDVMQEATAVLLRRREACEVLDNVLARRLLEHGPQPASGSDASLQGSGKHGRLSREERKRRITRSR